MIMRGCEFKFKSSSLTFKEGSLLVLQIDIVMSTQLINGFDKI